MFRSIPLRIKLLALLLIPLAAFFISGSQVIVRSLSSFKIYNAQSKNLIFYITNLDMIESLQYERGTSSRFLSGSLTSADYGESIKRTDASKNDWQTLLMKAATEQGTSAKALNFFNSLEPLRNSVKNKSAGNEQIIEKYSEIIAFLKSVADAGPFKNRRRDRQTSVRDECTAQCKESSGIVRAYSTGAT